MREEANDLREQDEFGCTLFIETEEEHPSIITNSLEIQPSECIVKGSQKFKKTGEVIADSFNDKNLWVLKMDKQYGNHEIYLNRSIELMLDFLDTKESAVLSILSRFPKNHLLCYAYFYDYNPYFKFNKNLIKRLSKYSIDIEFDMYCLAE